MCTGWKQSILSRMAWFVESRSPATLHVSVSSDQCVYRLKKARHILLQLYGVICGQLCPCYSQLAFINSPILPCGYQFCWQWRCRQAWKQWFCVCACSSRDVCQTVSIVFSTSFMVFYIQYTGIIKLLQMFVTLKNNKKQNKKQTNKQQQKQTNLYDDCSCIFRPYVATFFTSFSPLNNK